MFSRDIYHVFMNKEFVDRSYYHFNKCDGSMNLCYFREILGFSIPFGGCCVLDKGSLSIHENDYAITYDFPFPWGIQRIVSVFIPMASLSISINDYSSCYRDKTIVSAFKFRRKIFFRGYEECMILKFV